MFELWGLLSVHPQVEPRLHHHNMASEVEAAREKYIDDLDKTLQHYEQVDSKLSALQAALTSADGKLNEAHQRLDKRLTQAKAASTASSAASIVGVILLFSPLAPLGAGLTAVSVGLTAVGAAASVATSLIQTLVFEGDASKAFVEILNEYNSSSQALQDQLNEIEKAKFALTESLAQFMATLEKPGVYPSIPEGPKGGQPDVPKPDPGSNHFSTTALKGLANAAAGGKPFMNVGPKTTALVTEALTKLLGERSGKLVLGLSKLAKGVPVLSIVADVASIVSTWTSTNETLQQIDKLRKDLQANAALFRDAVSQLITDMEGLVGNRALQVTLRKLTRLRAAMPRRPGGPPGGIDPDQACKAIGLMKQMPDVPMLLFASLQNPDDNNDDSHQPNKYLVEVMPKSDVLQLGELPICAPVVDSVYDKYPDMQSRREKEEPGDDKPHESMISAIQSFRDESKWKSFGEQECYNVAGSTIDKPSSGSWIDFWRWFYCGGNLQGCVDPDCQIREPDPHDDTLLRGGHMEKKWPGAVKYWYILPICGAHNTSKKYDRDSSNWMTTKKSAWAVRIKPVGGV
ncbi:hypothetical protein D9611_009485 [Ephemerocybe angulata]|uniref:Uncharacterized protein n=1 Tax=Ephemerocybe angulata TaxID=980116 RepID=A0A8H5AVD1_9AGAR|nr:hypothetical protein D9611_009485 [Tulosesus angulatus]